MLERLLAACPAKWDAEVAQLARWTHHLVAALLHRGTTEDEERAYFYLEKVVTTLNSQPRNMFPDDESRWFASVAWGKGAGNFKWVAYPVRADRQCGQL